MEDIGPDSDSDFDLEPDGRTEHFSLLNHDIRAAMSDVIGGLRLVDMSGLDMDTRLQLERVRSSGEVLARLVEEALTIIGEAAPQPEARTILNLGRFLHDLDMRWSGRARALEIGFQLILEGDIPLVISTNRMALDRVLGNLLSNALKYGDAGPVRLIVEQSGDDALVFHVQDDGPGFSDEALERLYQYAGRPENSAKPGTGLGLRIAREMADRIGGQLSVSTSPQGGAGISLRLPRKAWALDAGERAPINLPDLTGLKVLVAEDNETNQLLAGQMLTTMGAEYEIAPDGVEALNWLEREDFDLALIDIEMPRLNGLAAIQEIRSKPGRQAQMPLIALTAYVLKANRDAIFSAGADGIIAKPVMDINTFGSAIIGHLGPLDGERELADPPPPDAAPDAAISCQRMDELLRIAGPATAPELLDRLIADFARVGANLDTAARENDRDSARAETHVLISLSGAIGADGLYKLATALNTATHRQDYATICELGPKAVDLINAIVVKLRAKRAAVATS